MSKIYGDTVGGGGVNLKKIPQSDWNQTDETQCNYIKNKPDLTRVVTTGTNHNINKPTQPTPELIYEQKEDGTYKCTGISDSFEGDTILVADWYNDHYVTEVDAIFNQTVFIPSHVTRVNIGNSKAVIFDESARLTDFTITDAQLETIVLPANIKNVKDNMFLNCVPTTLVFKGTPDSIGTLLSNSEGCNDIYVPWLETDSINVNAPWGFAEATIHYNFPVEVFNMDGTWKTLDDYMDSYTNGDTAKVIKNMKRIDEEGLAKGWYDKTALEKFQNSFNRVYVEQSRNRGIYGKAALTSSGKFSAQPVDYDIDDQEIPYYLGSIPTRLNGSEKDPDANDTDTRYRVGHIKVPPVDVDNFPTAEEANEFATSKLYVDSAIKKSSNELTNYIEAKNNVTKDYSCKNMNIGVISGSKIASDKASMLMINPKYEYVSSTDNFFRFDTLFKYSGSGGEIYFATRQDSDTLNGWIALRPNGDIIALNQSTSPLFNVKDEILQNTWVRLSIYGKFGGKSYLEINDKKYDLGNSYAIPADSGHLRFVISMSKQFAGNIHLSSLKYDVETNEKIISPNYNGYCITLPEDSISTSNDALVSVSLTGGFWNVDKSDSQAIDSLAINYQTLKDIVASNNNYYTNLSNYNILVSDSKTGVYSPITFKPNVRSAGSADANTSYITEFNTKVYREELIVSGEISILFLEGGAYPLYLVLDFKKNQVRLVANNSTIKTIYKNLDTILPINMWNDISLNILATSSETKLTFKINNIVILEDNSIYKKVSSFGVNAIEYPLIFAPSKAMECKIKLKDISYWSTRNELTPNNTLYYSIDKYANGEAIPTSNTNNIYQSGGSWSVHRELEDNVVVNKKYVDTYSPLAGKKIAYHGDSICESRADISKASYNGGGYAKIIADMTGSTYINNAGSGSVFVSAIPEGQTLSNTAKYIVTDMDKMPDDADIICFQGGINDWFKKCPFGELSDEDDYTGTLDTTTVIGALESICRKAINKWTGKPICFIITHKIANGNSAYAKCSGTDSWSYKELHDVMVQIFNKYSIPYLDMFNEGGLNSYMDIHNALYFTGGSSGTPDKTHPNEEAYRKYYVPKLIKLFESLI